MVDQIFASSNRLISWLRQVARLKLARRLGAATSASSVRRRTHFVSQCAETWMGS